MKTRHVVRLRRATNCGLFAVLLLGAVAPLAPAGIINLSASRTVYAQSEINNVPNIPGPITSTATGVFAPGSQVSTSSVGNDSISSTVDQNTNVLASGTTISGGGSASFTSSMADSNNPGSVYFGSGVVASGETVLFTLTKPYSYSATGSVTHIVSGDPGVFSNDIALLADRTRGKFVFLFDGNAVINTAGTLLPGDYTLGTVAQVGNEILAKSDVSALGAWNIKFQLTPTPEPGSLVLLITGLATIGGLGWLKKRKTKLVAA